MLNVVFICNLGQFLDSVTFQAFHGIDHVLRKNITYATVYLRNQIVQVTVIEAQIQAENANQR